MTRYYFDIIENGIIEVDETGAEFPDLSAAVAEARRTIMEMLPEASQGKATFVTPHPYPGWEPGGRCNRPCGGYS